MKTIILEQGAEALIVRTDTQMIQSLPYESISEITLKPQVLFQGTPIGGDFFVIISSGKEIRIDYDNILSPSTVNSTAMLNLLLSWCYASATTTTETPTTTTTLAPTTTTTEPIPDHVYPIYWLDNQAVVADYIWLNSSVGDVQAIILAASSYRIINTVSNNKSFVRADILATGFIASRTRIAIPVDFLNAQEFTGQLEVYN